MKHNKLATANALALVGGILYFICAAWVIISQSSFMAIMNTWAHGVDLTALPSKQLDMVTLSIGLVTFTGVAWLTGWAFASIYNCFLGKK